MEIDRYSEVPPWRQLADELRQQILSGKIPPGRPIPSKRTAMQEWGIAGNTYEKVVGQLKAENLVRSSPGMGIYVRPRGDWTTGS